MKSGRHLPLAQLMPIWTLLLLKEILKNCFPFSLKDAKEEQDDTVFTCLWEGHIPSNIFQDSWKDTKILVWG